MKNETVHRQQNQVVRSSVYVFAHLPISPRRAACLLQKSFHSVHGRNSIAKRLNTVVYVADYDVTPFGFFCFRGVSRQYWHIIKYVVEASPICVIHISWIRSIQRDHAELNIQKIAWPLEGIDNDNIIAFSIKDGFFLFIYDPVLLWYSRVILSSVLSMFRPYTGVSGSRAK